MADGLAVFFWG